MSHAIHEILVKKLSEIDFRKHTDKYCFKDTLKSSLLSQDPSIKINISEPDNFIVKMNIDEYSKCISNDFYFGYNRIDKLKKDLSILLVNESSAPWKVVTAYYVCFFSAIEISKIYGIFNLNLTNEEKEILISSPNINGDINSFKSSSMNTFFGLVSLSSDIKEITIKFKSGGQKPHRLAWENLEKVINSALEKREDHYSRMIKNILSQKSNWTLPSNVRNEWNYYRSDLFERYGNDLTKYFISILKRYQNINSWYDSDPQPQDEIAKVTSIAFIFQILTSVLENIKGKILITDYRGTDNYILENVTIKATQNKRKKRKKRK